MKNVSHVDLAWAGGIILLALGATLALQLGLIDQDSAVRVVAMNGLMVAYYGNRAPKTVAPDACARQVARVAGWSFVLSGLIYAGFWAFAPIPLAMTIGTGAVAVGVIVTLGYSLRLRGRARADA